MKFHFYRHTFASRLFREGEPVATVRQYLGHSSIEITEAVYIHIIDRKAANEAYRQRRNGNVFELRRTEEA